MTDGVHSGEAKGEEAAGPRSIDRRGFLALGGAALASTLASPAFAETRDMGSRFVWGAGTSSYQIEGSPTRAGGGASVWDTFCRRPGAIRDGSSGDIACDHINRWREDVALMRDLGLRAYRFSISWPRVMPEGTGRVNAEGLDFYDRLVDALLAAGIEPWVTLFHWDYPEALHKRGGWSNDASPEWFAQYSTVVGKRLSDRVTHWLTFNEPHVFMILGYQISIHAPGEKLAWKDILRIGHRVLLAHGMSALALRASTKRPCEVGYVGALEPAMPATERAADIEAARRTTFSELQTWMLDPVYLGAYPEAELKAWEQHLPSFGAQDFKTIRQPLDFFATNIYQAGMVRAGGDGKPERIGRPLGAPRTTMEVFDVVPGSLYWGPRFCWERYHLPVVITENGMSNNDWVATDGQVHDPQRIDFMRRYLRELARSRDAGVDVRGYFAWSLLDNFEWAEGYRQRFGLVYTDFATQKRTPKDSFAWYRDVIRSNGASL